MEAPEFEPYAVGEKHFSPEDEAAGLGIPAEHRDDPMVEQFTTMVARLRDLQQDLSVISAHRRPIYHAPGVRVSGDTLAEARKVFGAPDMIETPSERYSSAELLLRAVVALMTKDLGPQGGASDKREQTWPNDPGSPSVLVRTSVTSLLGAAG